MKIYVIGNPISSWYGGKSNVQANVSPLRSFLSIGALTSPFRPHRSLIKPADIAGINVGMSVSPEITEGRTGLMIVSREWRSGREESTERRETIRSRMRVR